MNLRRAFDIVAGSALAVISLPILAGACCASALSLRSAPIYQQQRVGLNGQIFTLYKIKSMRDAFDGNGYALPDSERITKIGKFLRTSKIDELPQCFNVISGAMSLVGPRPAPVYMDVLAEDIVRHTVRPGLTGLAQLACQGNLTDEEILDFDYQYVHSQSFMNDLNIVLQTPKAIVKNCRAPTYRASGQERNL